MIATTPSPSRLLRITAVTARWLLGVLIAAWLVFALSVAVLHGWIVPRIGEYRGALEAQASRAIGVPVRIGAIEARSQGLFPVVELRDVVLQDAQQREALRVARVVASVSPRSLWRLSFEQLYIEQVELDVRRDADGRLHVAGLDMSTETSGETRGADWFFSQREFVIENGTVRWTDERRGAEPLLLTDVRFVARNTTRRHQMRLDATPPEGWGERFSLRGRFRQPLLSVRSGNWQTWDGEIHAELPRIDVTRLGRYVALDARIREADGALRLWGDVRNGKPIGAAADLALARVNTSLGPQLEPLVLRQVTGRLAGRLDDEAVEFSTQALQFDTEDGLRWPGGNLWFRQVNARDRQPEAGSLRADRLDLAALALIANRLPLGEAVHGVLSSHAPRGLVEGIDASWQGPLEAPTRYQARGRAVDLSVAAQPGEAVAGDERPPVGTPGVRGATVDFDFRQDGGTATLSIAQGALELPGVFEEPVVPIDQLSTQIQWQREAGSIQLQMPELRFANADAEGQARLAWRTSDPATSRSGSRFPGVLDLQGRLSRADGTRVFRYLPLDIPKGTRDYVRDAVTQGRASTVDFKVKGDLWDMPFTDPRHGEFRIAAKVAGVQYAYVPHENGGRASHWPALVGASGELVFERAGMLVRNARGRIAGAPGVDVSRAEARIDDMSHHAPVLVVDAQASGPLGEVLHAGAPLLDGAREFVAQAQATGSADYRLKLEMPLEDMEKTKVRASVALGGNELRLAPAAPPLTQVRGTLDFTESGFSLAGVQGRLAGGEVRVEGRGRYAADSHDLSLRAQGTVSAEGLRAAHEAAWLTRLAQHASGQAAYEASFGLRDGVPEFAVTSSLQGLGLRLPAPLAKAEEESVPLQIEKKVLRREARGGQAPMVHDRLTARLGEAASAAYVRDISGEQARLLHGAIRVGQGVDALQTLPEHGVLASIEVPRLDVDAWRQLFDQTATPVAATGEAGDSAESWLPTLLAIRAQEFIVAGRTLHDVVMGGTREGTLWRANVDATELSGYAEYRVAQAGRLYARLARLKIAPSEATQVESLLDEQPDTLPALDIVVDDFELMGRRLGRAEIDAVNRGGPGREWRLNKLSLAAPEGTFTAQGSWAAAPGAAAREHGARRTAMRFELDIADAGGLLGRMGMPDVLQRGVGTLSGDVAWSGSPFSIDYPSLSGQLNLNVGSGQFLKADPGIAKLLGVLSLQALPRRLTLDFRDVFSTGFAFDFVRGDATIAHGIASTNNLQMKGVNAAALMDGSADIARETQNLRVVVVPEINAGTAALVATAINPAIGLGAFLAQMVLSRPLVAAATQEFMIEGTWADPTITKVPRRVLPALPQLPSLPVPGRSVTENTP